MVTPLYGQSKTPGQNNYIPMLKEHFTEKNTQRPKSHILKKHFYESSQGSQLLIKHN